MEEALLNVVNLKTYFYTEDGVVRAVDGVNLKVKNNETIGLIGESGSGKTVTALSVLRIVPRPGKIVDGKILFQGKNILEKSEKEMQGIRGREIAMIFQDPASSLNPVFTIKTQLTEIIKVHEKLTKEEATEKCIKLLDMVGIPEAETRIEEYPHQFSGGMKQRIAIARALLCNPSLLFADEPTTNLDVTIQAQILRLIKKLQKEYKMSIVVITHDMGVIAETVDRVTVLYAGQVCEVSDTRSLFHNPKHPYTEALLTAVPQLTKSGEDLVVIPGNIPNMINPPSGCRFHPRCAYAMNVCKKKVPTLKISGNESFVACHRYEN